MRKLILILVMFLCALSAHSQILDQKVTEYLDYRTVDATTIIYKGIPPLGVIEIYYKEVNGLCEEIEIIYPLGNLVEIIYNLEKVGFIQMSEEYFETPTTVAKVKLRPTSITVNLYRKLSHRF